MRLYGIDTIWVLKDEIIRSSLVGIRSILLASKPF